VNPIIEREANRILKESLSSTKKNSEKADILTPWKRWDRTHREVYSPTGTVDPSTRSGMAHRVINPTRPDLNSRPNGLHSRPLDSSGSSGGPQSSGLLAHMEAHLNGE